MTSGDRRALTRHVGLPGAVAMGLGSILGTGVFVSIGLAAGLAGPNLVLALAVAALLAGLNGLSSAQLAAKYPVSGSTYAYAGRTISGVAGFSAGLLFMTAKSASAATAALGFSGYLGAALGWTASPGWGALLAVAAVTALVYTGVQRSNQVNAVIVGCTIAALVALVLVGAPVALGPGRANLSPWWPDSTATPRFLRACALLFVAYTGYGRIATLGEEVLQPARTIPRAIGLALLVVWVLYGAVGAVAVGVLGAPGYAEATRGGAPLQAVAAALGQPWLVAWVGLAAMTAMVGVMLNLILGLSRVLLAMGRGGDAPGWLATVDLAGKNPGPAVIVTGLGVGALVLIGDVRLTWSMSAFTVLVYYALTNAAALRLAPEDRRYPSWTPWAGMLGCLGLAVWIEPWIWAAGLAFLAAGNVARWFVRR